jgi:SAM-dependent methyltransferase
MEALQVHEISEANHRILNPFTDEKLMLVGEIARLRPEHRQLDLASGKGEMLCRFSQQWGIEGHGIDLSPMFVEAARRRAVELGVDGRVSFEQGDAGRPVPDPGTWDVGSCIGATWIGGGLIGTLELLTPALRDGGLLLIGEPYWNAPPPAAACAAIGVEQDLFASLVGTMERVEQAGLQLVEMVLADGDSWDRYEAAQWWTLAEWLRANPDHPDHAELQAHLADSRRAHLEYVRHYLGWGVFVLRAG